MRPLESVFTRALVILVSFICFPFCRVPQWLSPDEARAPCRIINRFLSSFFPRDSRSRHRGEAFCPLVYHALISRCPSRERLSFPARLFFTSSIIFSSSPGHSLPVLSTLSDARFPGFELGLSFLIVPRSLPTLPPLTRSFLRAFPICLSFPLVSPFSLLPYPFSSVDLSSAHDFTSHG